MVCIGSFKTKAFSICKPQFKYLILLNQEKRSGKEDERRVRKRKSKVVVFNKAFLHQRKYLK